MKAFKSSVSITWLLVSATILTGCASTAKIAAESTYLKSEIQSGRMTENIKRVDLTPAQAQFLTHAENKVDAFLVKWRDNLADPSLALLTEESQKELLADYNDLKPGYHAVVDKVVKPNWEKYELITRLNLSSDQSHVEALDAAVNELIAAREQRQFAQGILQYVITFSQIAASLK